MANTTSDSILRVICKESWILDNFEIYTDFNGPYAKPLLSLWCWHLANKMASNQGF